MPRSSSLLLLCIVVVLPCDAMVSTLDITRLPNCHQARLVQYAMRQHLDRAKITYALKSVKLVTVQKQVYHALPEKWVCQGILAFEHQGQHIQQPFHYRIAWTNTVTRHIDFHATFLSE